VRVNIRHDEPEVSARIKRPARQNDRRRSGAPGGVRDRGRARGRDQQGRQAGRARTLRRAQILYWILSETEARLTGSIGCTHVTWLDTAELAVAIRWP